MSFISDILGGKSSSMSITPSDEIQYFAKLDYISLVNALNEKYGAVPAAYFTDDSMSKKNNKITRTNEGLFIHHVAENKYLSLSNPQQAIMYSYDLQQPDMLVYCNYLEHLLLHAKIMIEYGDREVAGSRVGFGGAYTFLIPTLNDLYSGWKPTKRYQNNCWLAISDRENDYLFIIKYMIAHNQFSDELYTSFNDKFDLWDNGYNRDLYDKFVKLGAPKYNELTLMQNNKRMKQNIRVADQSGDKKKKRKPFWLRWWILVPAFIVFGIAVAFMIIGKVG